MAKKSKGYRAAVEKITEEVYAPYEAFELLKEIASAGGGAYVHAGNDEFGLTPIINDIKKMQEEEYSSVVFEEYDEQFMYFLAIALALFVLEMLIGERRSRRHLFDKI